MFQHFHLYIHYSDFDTIFSPLRFSNASALSLICVCAEILLGTVVDHVVRKS